MLALSGTRLELDGDELERLLAFPGLALQLAALIAERGGRGSRENLPGLPVTLNAFKNKSGALRSGVKEGVQGKPSGGDDVDNFASYLADALDDRKSFAWYCKVVAHLPREVVLDAFQRARDTRRQDIRRSRAALFTSIVRPLMNPTLCPRDFTPGANRA